MEKLNDILLKVSILFKKYGIKSITMDDISREAGISKKTLYQFVTEKTDLVNMVIDSEMTRTRECFEAQRDASTNAISELLNVNKLMVGMMKRYSPSFDYDLKKYYPDAYQRVVLNRRKKMFDSVLSNLRRGKQEGLYRQELKEEVITRLQVSRLENMYSDVMLSIEDYSTENIFKELFIYHIRGIANEKGIKYLEENLHKFDYSDTDMFGDKSEMR
jgi:TetR/AcrR family transcriptional regulator, cholesterol catabolism regulator